MGDRMAETVPISELLRRVRLEQGLDLATLARRTGVARNHLADIEEGYAGSFHSLAYCRRAVVAYAQVLGIADQVDAHWDDRAWRLVPNGARITSLEASSTGLLPSLDGALAARKWLLPAVGILGLILVGWLSLGRIDQEPTEQPVAAVTPPAVIGQQPPAAQLSGSPSGPITAPVVSVAPAGSAPLPSSAVQSVTPAAPQPNAFRLEVERAMGEWVRRWVARDIEGYVRFYGADFVGATQHLSIRRQRMAQAKFIKVTVSETSYLETAPGEITVRFRQVYESDSYSSSDRKEIVWRQTPSGPRIRAERLVN